MRLGVQQGSTLHLAFSSTQFSSTTREIHKTKFLMHINKVFALDQLVQFSYLLTSFPPLCLSSLTLPLPVPKPSTQPLSLFWLLVSLHFPSPAREWLRSSGGCWAPGLQQSKPSLWGGGPREYSGGRGKEVESAFLSRVISAQICLELSQ